MACVVRSAGDVVPMDCIHLRTPLKGVVVWQPLKAALESAHAESAESICSEPDSWRRAMQAGWGLPCRARLITGLPSALDALRYGQLTGLSRSQGCNRQLSLATTKSADTSPRTLGAMPRPGVDNTLLYLSLGTASEVANLHARQALVG